jgi:hypothetical protein
MKKNNVKLFQNSLSLQTKCSGSLQFPVCFFMFFCLLVVPSFAQNKIDYKAELFTVLGQGDYTPFWITSNTYGVVPLKSNNAYLRTALSWDQMLSEDWKLEAGVDLITATNHTSDVWIQQFYADISFQQVKLSIGSKERYNSMLDRKLSVGDFDYSGNARPIPEVYFSVPEFTIVPLTKEIFRFKADFALGKAFENKYIRETKPQGADYSLDVLWHHKSLFFKLEDPREQFPFSLLFGLEHAVQWGGWTSHKSFGKLPGSIKDCLRVILGKQGGDNALEGDQVNVLGNHQGTYNIKLGYKHPLFEMALYKQHYYDDNSGMEYANWRDGIWGVEAEFFRQSYVKKIVLEYFQSTNQSGSMHFLEYNSSRDVRGGGDDDYYNHDFYFSGWSYFGRGLGNPLITSPEYNDDNALYFKNNRIKAIHLGVRGDITSSIDYRVLLTGMQSWGRMREPFLERKDNFSALLECNYNFSKWKFGLQLAVDDGEIYNNNWGISLKIARIKSFSF